MRRSVDALGEPARDRKSLPCKAIRQIRRRAPGPAAWDCGCRRSRAVVRTVPARSPSTYSAIGQPRSRAAAAENAVGEGDQQVVSAGARASDARRPSARAACTRKPSRLAGSAACRRRRGEAVRIPWALPRPANAAAKPGTASPGARVSVTQAAASSLGGIGRSIGRRRSSAPAALPAADRRRFTDSRRDTRVE
jgi:hypothetical protein